MKVYSFWQKCMIKEELELKNYRKYFELYRIEVEKNKKVKQHLFVVNA